MTFQKKYITIILQGRKHCLLFMIKGKKWYSTKPPESSAKAGLLLCLQVFIRGCEDRVEFLEESGNEWGTNYLKFAFKSY